MQRKLPIRSRALSAMVNSIMGPNGQLVHGSRISEIRHERAYERNNQLSQNISLHGIFRHACLFAYRNISSRRHSNRRLPLRDHLAQAEANTLRYLLDGNRIHSRDDHSVAQQVGHDTVLNDGKTTLCVPHMPQSLSIRAQNVYQPCNSYHVAMPCLQYVSWQRVTEDTEDEIVEEAVKTVWLHCFFDRFEKDLVASFGLDSYQHTRLRRKSPVTS